MPRKKIAVIIPAHNEEKVIGNTLKSLVKIVAKENIYVISDASTDKTREIVNSFGVNYTRTHTNNGKVTNLKKAIDKFKLTKRYKYISVIDADTRPSRNFFKLLIRNIEKNGSACVCGQVESEKKMNLFVFYRSIMYFIWQNFHKRLCNVFNAITIAPGTASLFRSSVLEQLEFDENLIIEDFDLTFQVHRKRLGRVTLEPKATIVTQDPDNLRDTFKQVNRWQTGFLQAAYKHNVPFGGQAFDWAILILILQEIIHTLIILTIVPLFVWFYFFALYPSLFGHYIQTRSMLTNIIFNFGLIFSLGLLYTVVSRKYLLLRYLPFLWFVQFIYIAAFIKSFYDSIFRNIKGSWVSPERR